MSGLTTSGHPHVTTEGLKSANNGLMHCSNDGLFDHPPRMGCQSFSRCPSDRPQPVSTEESRFCFFSFQLLARGHREPADPRCPVPVLCCETPESTHRPVF